MIFRTFAVDYENKDKKAHICMAVVIGIPADADIVVFTCP
jgi:hypothetical protein